MVSKKLLLNWAPLAIYPLLAVVWLLFTKKHDVFPLDDTYIHLAYVRNLVETGTLSINPGEASTGTSGPLWVGLLAFFYWLGADLYWTVVALSSIGLWWRCPYCCSWYFAFSEPGWSVPGLRDSASARMRHVWRPWSPAYYSYSTGT